MVDIVIMLRMFWMSQILEHESFPTSTHCGNVHNIACFVRNIPVESRMVQVHPTGQPMGIPCKQKSTKMSGWLQWGQFLVSVCVMVCGYNVRQVSFIV